MKIIAKECPKCGANLQFKLGDHEAHCDSCRRDFIIKYDHEKTDLSPEDFKLDPSLKFFTLFVRIVAVIMIITSVFIFISVLITRQKMVEGLDDGFYNTETRIEELHP